MRADVVRLATVAFMWLGLGVFVRVVWNKQAWDPEHELMRKMNQVKLIMAVPAIVVLSIWCLLAG